MLRKAFFLNKLRGYAQNYPVLYRLWFSWYIKEYGLHRSLPYKGDSLILDGFPRSGNTYFTAMFKYFFPDKIIRDHYHCVAPLKIAMKYDIPVIILIRDPAESILSRFLQVSEGDSEKANEAQFYLKKLVDDWIDYYSFCCHNSSYMRFMVFEKCISDPYLEFLDVSREMLDDSIQLKYEDVKEFDTSFKKKDKEKPQGSTSAPNVDRNREKDKFRKLLCQQKRLHEAQNIYRFIAENPAN